MKKLILKKIIALCTSASLILQSFIMSIPQAKALTGGPSQPEFTSFEPVTTNNMVNDFTGAFTYNLPLLTVPGPHGVSYPISLSYHNGRQPNEDASWVGLGWTLNPGAAVRNKRGFPDDYNGAEVHYYNKQRPVKTFSLTGSVAAEYFSADPSDEGISIPLADASLSAAIHFNNYKGVGYSVGLSAGMLGMASLDYSKSETEHSFSGKVNPAGLLSHVAGEFLSDIVPDFKSTLAQEAFKVGNKFVSAKLLPAGVGAAYTAMGGKFSYYSTSSEVRPTNIVGYSGESVTLKVSVGGTPFPVPVEANAGLTAVFGTQKNIATEVLNAYGYMYSANAEENDMMDIGIERNNGFNRNDYYLPIPVSNYDMWSFTGEGSMGGARMYHKTVGHYKPNNKSSSTFIGSLGLELTLGLDFGAGWSETAGEQNLSVSDWNESGSLNAYSFASIENGRNEPVFFKFDSDLGGATNYYSNDHASQASINQYSDGKFKAIMPLNIYSVNNNDENSRTGRTAFIGFHTMNEMKQKSTAGNSSIDNYYSYTKNTNALSIANYSNRSDDIGELAVIHENGMQYVYGQPVYARREGTFRYGLLKEDGKTSLIDNTSKPGLVTVSSSFLNSAGSEPDMISFMGEYSGQPYVSSCLLTQITSSDYIDKTMNGPSDDDFGGWVEFDYDRYFGSNDKEDNASDWYNWRIPYNGLNYQKNSLSDELDDEGIVSFGEKEVYYLSTIETQTHIAEFLLESREDGIEAVAVGAPNSTEWPTSDGAATDFNKQGTATNALMKLDRIVLYAKIPILSGGYTKKPLKIVNFEYDYSLCEGLPDNEAKTSNDEGTGKLTLKKLWMEDIPDSYSTSSGVYGAQTRISPYEFSYEYKTSYPAEISGRYDMPTSIYDQNPDYDEARYIDSWGNYQSDGETRTDNLQTWPDQSATAFDPGAWELKVITLPSKGQILVEYESHDYQYVQDKRAMALVNLFDDDGDGEYTVNDTDPSYQINLSQLGIDVENETNVRSWVSFLEKYFADKKIYFNHLYTLQNGTSPGLNSSSEYISGYAAVKEISYDLSGTEYIISITLDASNADAYQAPNQVCKEFKKTHRIGSASVIDFLENSTADIEAGVYTMIEMLTGFDGEEDIGCKTVNTDLSYFRIPMLTSKIGGGNRVKSLLMYDDGITGGAAKVYGKRYNYTTTDENYGTEISSGVISTEPQGSRGENPLVHILPRAEQTSWERIVAGRDKRQMEGPLGESLMPSAMIGYAKVTITDIHQGSTSPGFIINEFYTMKDEIHGHSAFSCESTEIDMENYQKQIQGIFRPTYIDHFILTQGYSFNYYEINGKPKQTRICGGTTDNFTVSKNTVYQYYNPDETLSLYDGMEITESEYPRDEELVLYSSQLIDHTEILTIEFDATLGIFALFAIPYFIGIPMNSIQESGLMQHITCKNNKYPVLLKEIITTENGIEYAESYSAFDKFTGKPSVTTASGLEFNGESTDGLYRKYSLFAPHRYTETGQKSSNERSFMEHDPNSLTITECQSCDNISSQYSTALVFESPDGSVDLCSLRNLLYPGDLVQLSPSGSGPANDFYNVGNWDGNILQLYASSQYGSVNIGQGYNVDVEVIKSGRTNQLNASISSITTYGSDWVLTEEFEYDIERERLVNELNSNLSASNYNFTIDLSIDYPDLSISEAVTGAGQGCMTVSEYVAILATPLLLTVDFASGNSDIIVAGPPTTAGTTQECRQTLHIADVAYYDSPGYFKIDEYSGDIVFISSDMECENQLVECLESCEKSSTYYHLDNVVSSSAQTLNDGWKYSPWLYRTNWSTNQNIYEKGNYGKWRPAATYIYNTSISGLSSSTSTLNNYEAGLYDNFVLFNHSYPSVNEATDWLKLSEILEYAPNGEATSDSNIIGNYSSIRFGYYNDLPLYVTNNAQDDEAYYEGFENIYNFGGSTYMENALNLFNLNIGSVSSSAAHTGESSFSFILYPNPPIAQNLDIKDILLTEKIKDNGLSVRMWVMQSTSNVVATLDMENIFDATLAVSGVVQATGSFSSVAKTGDWELLECIFDPSDFNASGFVIGSNITPTIRFLYTGANVFQISVYADDIRVQPINSQLTCYVYDNNYKRISAILDEQHFSTFYQYDGEGRLVSLRKETEKGVKTIQEKQFHIPSETR